MGVPISRSSGLVAGSGNNHRIARRRMLSSTGPIFEGLEDRRLLSGNVTAVLTGTTLTITCLDAGNQVGISAPASNNISVNGLDGENVTLTGDTGGVFVGVKTLIVNTTSNATVEMGGIVDVTTFTYNGGVGQDVLNFGVDACAFGKATINLGGGNDGFSARNLNVTGLLTVNGGDGGNALNMRGNINVGSLTMSGGEGGDTFTFGELGQTIVTKDVKINGGDGDDELTLINVQIGGNVTLAAGAGAGTMALDEATVGGNVTVTAPDGGVLVGLTDSTIGGNTTVTTGAGDDTIIISEVTTKGITLKLGDGVNETDISDLTSGNFTYTTSTSVVDRIESSGLIDITGNLTINSGASNSTFFGLEQSLGANTVTGNVTINNNAPGIESLLRFDGWTVGGSLKYKTGAGTTDVDVINGSIAKNLELTTGDGAAGDSITLDDLSIAGNVKITSKGGNDVITYDRTPSGGSITVDLGAGDDAFTLNGLFLPGQVFVTNVTIKGGDGDDQIQISEMLMQGTLSIDHGAGTAAGLTTINNVSVQKNLTIKAAAGEALFTGSGVNGNASFTGIDQIVLDDLSFSGNLTIKAPATLATSLTVRDVDVTGNFSLTTGNLADFVDIADFECTGSATIKLLAGDDDLLLPDSVFRSKVSIDLGEGINQFSSGTLTADGDFTFKAGAGSDTVNLGQFQADGKLTVNLGNGSNEFEINDAVDIVGDVSITTGIDNDNFRIANLLFRSNLTIKSGAGDDRIDMEGANTVGKVSIDAGAGANVFDIAFCLIEGTFAVKAGEGNDTFSTDNLAVAGGLTMNLGNGTNNIDLEGGELGGTVTITTGIGVDDFDVDGVIFSGSLAINSGAGGDLLSFVGINVTGKMTIDLSTGDDNLQLHVSSFIGAVRLIGGIGNDTADLIDALDEANTFPLDTQILTFEQDDLP